MHHGLLAVRHDVLRLLGEAADKWDGRGDVDDPGLSRLLAAVGLSERANLQGGTQWHHQPIRRDDEQRLAELGYKQELHRNWSGFSNFAISFSIISILAGCFTTFGQAWNNGGPVAISWGWPLISIFILIIGLCMSELVSAYPTAGGIYWWAAKMGKPIHGWFTGWLNLIGLVAVTASVDYGCATFLNLTLLDATSRLGRHA